LKKKRERKGGSALGDSGDPGRDGKNVYKVGKEVTTKKKGINNLPSREPIISYQLKDAQGPIPKRETKKKKKRKARTGLGLTSKRKNFPRRKIQMAIGRTRGVGKSGQET